MAKKKQKIKRIKETQRGKASGATKMESKKKKTPKEDETVEDADALEISQTVTDVKSFIEKFRADVGKRRKGYQLFARAFQKKK